MPYAYWLHRQGRLERTIGGLDTRCLSYFSENHEERPVERHYVPITEYPVGERGWPFGYDLLTFPRVLDTRKWSPPPYREAFRDERFRVERHIRVGLRQSALVAFAHRLAVPFSPLGCH